jgi:transposase
VAGCGTTLTELHGVGDVIAARILARSGAVSRFRPEPAFASYCGVAPIEVSSGDVQRHRLSRAGYRQLNYALHVMAMAQIKRATPGRDYYQRKRAVGKTHKEAMHCLRTPRRHRLPHMIHETETSAARP